MNHEAYRAGIAELYAAEVLGEALASRWLELSSSADQKFKLALFLQLESEAKVRLRPRLARHGLELVEDQGRRCAASAVAEEFAAMPWRDAVAAPEDLPLVSFMAAHEAAVIGIAKREAAGHACMDSGLLPMLAYPLVRRS
jgi:hypothetical protein